MKRTILIALLAALCGCSFIRGIDSGTRTYGLPDHGIPNLRQVDASKNIWRGGQPTEAGWEYLKGRGITNVVKLNTDGEASDGGAVASGMAVRYYPITLGQQLGLQTNWNVWEPAAHVTSNTFVHCQHGEDRTGLVVATYRIETGWSKADAEKEMLDGGFHKALRGLWDHWESLKE